MPTKKQPVTYNIRQAKLKDVPLLAYQRAIMFVDMGVIKAEAAKDIEHTSLQKITKMLKSKEFFGFLIELEEEVIGSAGLTVRQLLPSPLDLDPTYGLHVENVFIEKKHRRRGAGRQLMQHIIKWAKDKGIRRITLHTSDQGKALYQSLGFSFTKEMRKM